MKSLKLLCVLLVALGLSTAQASGYKFPRKVNRDGKFQLYSKKMTLNEYLKKDIDKLTDEELEEYLNFRADRNNFLNVYSEFQVDFAIENSLKETSKEVTRTVTFVSEEFDSLDDTKTQLKDFLKNLESEISFQENLKLSVLEEADSGMGLHSIHYIKNKSTGEKLGVGIYPVTSLVHAGYVKSSLSAHDYKIITTFAYDDLGQREKYHWSFNITYQVKYSVYTGNYLFYDETVDETTGSYKKYILDARLYDFL